MSAMTLHRRAAPLVLAVASACSPAPPPAASRPPAPPAPPSAVAAIRPDPLGPRPAAPPPAPFIPPTPLVYAGPNGMTVWVVERHALPIVAATMAVSVGAASDPQGKQGLAWVTANMLDEGAGKLGAIAFAKQIEALGAQVRTGASLDYAHASLTVLKRNLTPAFALFGDVVARPRFEAGEWQRVHELWRNDLLARGKEPEAVAHLTALRALYGEASAYGHPVDGFVASAKNVQLADARAFYKEKWRPDVATLVVVGDVTRAELDPLLATAFGEWKAPVAAKPAPLVPPPPAPSRASPARSGAWPRVVVVDRADAPQSVIALVRPARPAADPDAAMLTRVNIALGGSFTSRLNQDLREEHGWSYGARSRVTLLRGTSSIVASAAVQTEHTGEALEALVKDVESFAATGLTDDELAKTRLMARGELVELFESVDGAAMRLARDAAIGLGPDYEAKASLRRDGASKDELARAAREFDPKDAYIVVVGPRAKLEKQLAALGALPIEARDAEGGALK
jgi:zinc protease